VVLDSFAPAPDVALRGANGRPVVVLLFDIFQDESDQNTIYEVYRDDAASPHYPAWGNLPADWFVGQKAVVIRGTDHRALGGRVPLEVGVMLQSCAGWALEVDHHYGDPPVLCGLTRSDQA
jgi:hypothetical protein